VGERDGRPSGVVEADGLGVAGVAFLELPGCVQVDHVALAVVDDDGPNDGVGEQTAALERLKHSGDPGDK
jgi:hypothetical protein